MKFSFFSRFSSRGAFGSAFLTALLLPIAAFAVGNPQVPRGLKLGHNAHGHDAVEQLGDQLPEVAKAYGLKSEDLADRFHKQPSLWVDREGSLVYLCEGLPVASASPAKGSTVKAGTTANATTAVATPVAAVPSTFTLHSTPGSTRVIYLDFTGHVTSGTSWNSSFAGGDIVSQPFDLDGDSTTFSESECAFIYRVWQRVAEDFAPFAVDVTTEDPGIEALRKTTTGDNAYGQRVVISPTNWYSTSAGGVSYIGSFNWNSDTPNFVFTQQLANGEKYIAEAISHETGHSLGLSHDGLGGTSPTEYYAGQGNWAPIMGNSYYKGITQWCKGEYLNANNTQDQLSIMQSYGAPLIGNTYGSSLATATVLTPPNVNLSGTIIAGSDVDCFRFVTDAGAVSFTIANLTPEPNLNIQAQLLDGGGNVILNGVPSTTSVTLATTLAAGTYYLKVGGIGSGDPVTNGFSNYGSVGNYALTGTFVVSGNQLPVAAVSTSTTSGVGPLPVNFSSSGSYDPDGTIAGYLWNFGDGISSTEINPSHVYNSTGVFTATLTVTDNGNVSSTSNVVITVVAPPNLLPVAIAAANQTSGVAPLPITFSSAGSYDLDGSIVSYAWDFGDGTSSSSANPSHTYTVAGNYSAKLIVIDDRGGSSSSTVTISVAADVNLDADVAQFTLSVISAPSGKTPTVTVIVRDRLGRPVSGATIGLSWSGLISGSGSAKTDATGTATLNLARTKKAGTVTVNITSVTPAAGMRYDSTIYSEPTSRSIAMK